VRNVPANDSNRLTGRNFPAMVLPIINTKGLVGAHVTWLSRDGKSKLSTDKPKKMFGPIKGGWIPLCPSDPDKPSIMAEGIENALSASQIAGGIPAIAAGSAGNMKHIPPPPCSELIIAADNDENGTGLKEAKEAAEALTGQSRVIRIAVPRRPDDWNKKSFDWNNALVRGEDLDDLRHSILRGKRYDVKRTVDSISMREFLSTTYPPQEMLIEPWLKTRSSAMIHAYRGGGKTWFALSAAYALATGSKLLDWNVKRCRVLYVDGELVASFLQERMRLLGRPPEDDDDLQIITPDLFGDDPMPNLAEEGGQKWIDGIIAKRKSDVVILDSLTTLIRGIEENPSEPWAPIQDWLLMHRRRGRSIILVHHDGKTGGQRGASKKEDILDSVLGLKEEKDLSTEDSSAFKLTFNKTRGFWGTQTKPMILRLSMVNKKAVWTREEVGKDPKQEKSWSCMARGSSRRKSRHWSA
jgi:putative DNA primase/helicase